MTRLVFGSDSILHAQNAEGEMVCMTPSRCRSGCPSQDHKSYSECARGIQVNTGIMLTTKQQGWDRELRAYKAARAEGIQPDGTQMHQVEQAKKISDATGVAYGG